MDIWIPISSAICAAIGGFLGTWYQLNSEKNKHLFDHKMRVYVNLIASYRAVVKNNSEEKYRQEYVSSQEQVELIGSEDVINISKEFYDNPQEQSPQIQTRLVQAMRKDLYSTGKF